MQLDVPGAPLSRRVCVEDENETLRRGTNALIRQPEQRLYSWAVAAALTGFAAACLYWKYENH